MQASDPRRKSASAPSPAIRRRTNLREIAQNLGISASTVSRALRGLPGIHPETREQVQKAAEKLGYRKAEILLQKRFRNILTLSQGFSTAADAGYLAGLSSAAVPMNMSLISHHYQPAECGNVLNPAFQPRALAAGQIDGIVLIRRWPDEIARALRKAYPVVSIIHSYPASDVDVVSIDDRSGVAALVAHLLAGGYRRIGFFGLCKEMTWSRTRFGGYVEAMVLNDLPVRMEDTVPVSLAEASAESEFFESESLRVAAARTESGVEAWVCASEMLASTLLNSLISGGWDVPGKVGVTGFHGSQSHTRYQRRVLTSTESPSTELGAAALRRLVHRLEGTDVASRSILLPCELLVGDTTRAVAG